MDYTAIVKRLIGSIEPVGASHIDDNRFENLKAMCELVGDLASEIANVARDNKDRYEASMKQAGKYAEKFLQELHEIATN